ncbi:MAG: hypothetical protein OIF50_09410 [Flavobacteriaceae bacterium]|nr:hypothetical protein [Flavobacteriaceae bacterium]
MRLNRKQLSFIISFCLIGIFVLTLFNLRLQGQKEDEYFTEILLEEDLEKLIEALEQQEEPQDIQAQQPKTHMAYNQAANNKYADTEPFKTLEELEAEGKTQEASEASDGNAAPDNQYLSSNNGASRLKELIEKRKASQASYGNKTTETLAAVNTVNKNASVTYSLIDRKGVFLPIPMYTCEKSGKIVVNIKVNKQGDVVEASVNTSSSTSTDGCLYENAIHYAYKASFDLSSKPTQIGTITFLFQGK